MLHGSDLTSDAQYLLPALLSKPFIWQSGSVRHRQELLSLSITAAQTTRSLRTSCRSDPREPRWGGCQGQSKLRHS